MRFLSTLPLSHLFARRIARSIDCTNRRAPSGRSFQLATQDRHPFEDRGDVLEFRGSRVEILSCLLRRKRRHCVSQQPVPGDMAWYESIAKERSEQNSTDAKTDGGVRHLNPSMSALQPSASSRISSDTLSIAKWCGNSQSGRTFISATNKAAAFLRSPWSR